MTIQLGLSGLEKDLQQKSLTVSSVVSTDNSSLQRAADKTLHVDILADKKTFTLTYGTISKSDYETLVGYYALQAASLGNLSFLLEEANGVSSYNVYLPPMSRGADLRDRPYYYDVSMVMEEI